MLEDYFVQTTRIDRWRWTTGSSPEEEVRAPHDSQEGKQLSHPDQDCNYARRDHEQILCVLLMTDARPFLNNVTDAYRRRRVCGKTDCDHNDIRQCPQRYNARKSIDAAEEALAARGSSCKHIATHHDATLRRE